jgi:hypothetical protein
VTVGRKGTTIESLREPYHVPSEIEELLRAYARAHSAEDTEIKIWSLGDQPELPYEHCRNPKGCHCVYFASIVDSGVGMSLST